MYQGAFPREGGSQLVGGVGDETPLRLEGGLETGEEVVEGVAERFELVLRPVEGQALVQAAGGDPSGRAGDSPDRPQDPAGNEPAGQEGEDGHDRQSDARVDQELVRVDRPLRGLGGPCLRDLVHGL